MASFKPTQEQLDVIGQKSPSVLVSANAGSGKTTTMINRILNLIESQKVDIKQILVLTFTNAAASDMKQKLFESLSQKASSSENCFDALLALNEVDIGTIHSFCTKICRTYFYIADIDPNFKIIDEINSSLLKEKAIKNTINKFFKLQNKEFIQFVSGNFEKRNLKSVKETIFRVFEFLSASNDKEGILKLTQNSHNFNLEENIAFEICCNYAKEQLEKIEKHLVQTLENMPCEEVEKFCKIQLSELNNLKTIASKTEFFEALIIFKLHSILEVKIKKDDACFEERTALHEKLKECDVWLKNAKQCFGAETKTQIENLLAYAKQNAEFVVLFANEFCQEYANLKKQKSMLDFSDLENCALKILSDSGAQEELKNKYKYIFTDEFQDVNLVQNAIIETIGNDCNSFVVGDPKQSIYGFRQTSPEIFIEKFESGKGQNNSSASLNLSVNFRSSKEILEFNNFVFGNAMKKSSGGVDYEQDGKFSLDKEGVSYQNNPCEIYIINKQKKEAEPIDKVYSIVEDCAENESMQYAKLEAEQTAILIEQAKEQGFSEGDIVLLCRNKNYYIKTLCSYLESFGYALEANFNDDLSKSIEANLVHSLICLSNNFKDDIVLTNVLLGPIFNFSSQELFDVRCEFVNKKHFYECVLEYVKEGKNEQIKNKLCNFVEFIKKLNGVSSSKNCYDFATYICNETNISWIINSIENGNESNLNAYLNALKSLENCSVSNYIELTESGEFKTKQNLESSQDKIKVCTIHSSKGLEYKVVILVGAGNQFNETDLKNSVFVDKKLGICAQSVDLESEEKSTNITKNACKILKQKEMFAEELRVLYVALTRAKNKLYIVGATNLQKQTKNSFSKSYLEIILNSLSNLKLQNLLDNKTVSLKSVQTFAMFNVADVSLLEKIKPVQSAFLLGKCDDNLAKDYAKILNETSIETPIVSKTTITKLANNVEQNFANQTLLPPEERERKMLLGTMYHKFFEEFDFNAQDKFIELERVLNLFDTNQKAQLEKSVLQKFLQSDLFALCKNKQIFKEKKFYFKEENGTIIQGVVDLLVVEDDGISVVDYKLSKASQNELKLRYADQVRHYATKCANILHTKVKKMYIYSILNAKLFEI